MKICVISHSYPTAKTIDFVFVDQLCRQFADKGHDVTVIAPQSITKCLFRHVPLIQYRSKLFTKKGNSFVLFRPIWISLGRRFTYLVGQTFGKAIRRTLRVEHIQCDVIYAHFWAQAIASLPYAEQNRIPIISVAGESCLIDHKFMSEDSIAHVRNTVKGCVCVSTKTKSESVAAGFVMAERCVVIPNAVDHELFYPRNKILMREMLGFPKQAFVVAFVGQWNSRKGIKKLCEALNRLGNSSIMSIFIGSGEEKPNYANTLYAGTVSHNRLPEFLSCADVFVLPTENEGCSNAIIEAMACGLPILSSDKDFNKDVLNETNSILFNPMDVRQIAAAIDMVYQNKVVREKLSKGALATAAKLSLPVRADRIIDFIKKSIDEHKS